MQGASKRMIAIAEACYANDFGCSLDQLGLSEMITENQRWDSGAYLWHWSGWPVLPLAKSLCHALPLDDAHHHHHSMMPSLSMSQSKASSVRTNEGAQVLHRRHISGTGQVPVQHSGASATGPKGENAYQVASL